MVGSATSRNLVAALPVDLTGLTVLDVGCGDGAVAREAAARGASSVTALDIDDAVLASARTVRSQAQDLIDYVEGDLEVALPAGRFDHVVCHDLLHRVRNPIDVIDRLIAATGGSLTMAVTGVGGEKPQRLLRRDYGIESDLGAELASLPMAVVGRNGTPDRKREEKFFFSPAALTNLLLEQRRHFSSLDISARSDEATTPGRYVLQATRRRIDHLVVVSGPTGSGKSTFLERLGAGDPVAHSMVGGGSGSAVPDGRGIARYRHTNGDGIAGLPHCLSGLLFHYDMLRPWRRNARVHARDEALHIFDCCSRLDVTVMVAPAPVLAQRLRLELASFADRSSRSARRLDEVVGLYADPSRLIRRIEAWVEFCSAKGATVGFVDSSEGYRTCSTEGWRSVIGSGIG